ncbi:MAG: hypothetical protein SCALA702_02670 [Melioribacteraceae bacterium]|nr:MAG: hypothetical protein SCALA702_02670 [Melioribacteraceae bacterium]
MKKLLLLMIIFSGILSAQDLTGYRIYINPGHGGYDSNDRFIAATGFWESVGNLHKGLELYDMLEDLGATVDISRTTNFSSDDLPLSVIAQLANQFNADYFHSIHSNAFNAQINYTLVLFRGYDNQPVFPQAKTMAQILWQKIYDVNRGYWTYGFVNARGDWDFYGSTSGLGVLRNLNMPGTLSEGSFHDYIPESWRLMNYAYKTHESFAIARSFLDLYNQPDYQFGIVAGILRDPAQGVSYYAIPATNDPKNPVGEVTVRLEPGNLTYTTDMMNNGYYMFDSLAPGNYTVYFEHPEYVNDSTEITVTAGVSKFADKMLQFDITVPPVVVSSNPENGANDVSAIGPYSFTFSREMSAELTQNAFEINPAVNGNISWSSDERTFFFTPDEPLEILTEYTVSFDTTARSVYGYSLDAPFELTFTTGSRNSLSATSFYPADGETGITTYPQVRINFDAPILQSSLTNKVALYDWNDAKLPVRNVQIVIGDLTSYIRYESKDELEPNSVYKAVFSAGIKDLEGYELQEDIIMNFTTTDEEYFSGNIFNACENLSDWVSPANNASSYNFNPDHTVLQTVNKPLFEGSASLELEYEFTAAEGEVYITLNSPFDIGTNTNSAGIWVFGDLSGNVIKYEFTISGSSEFVLSDTLDFAGWKMFNVDLNNLTQSDEILFKSVIVEKTGDGNFGGMVYFDALQTDAEVTYVEESNLTPDNFRLFQNHPNPFNPATQIKYQLKESSNVKLTVYDMLGSEIETLVNSEQPAGTYSVSFDASKLSSGIYFYTIVTENFVKTRKMVLIK